MTHCDIDNDYTNNEIIITDTKQIEIHIITIKMMMNTKSRRRDRCTLPCQQRKERNRKKCAFSPATSGLFHNSIAFLFHHSIAFVQSGESIPVIFPWYLKDCDIKTVDTLCYPSNIKLKFYIVSPWIFCIITL